MIRDESSAPWLVAGHEESLRKVVSALIAHSPRVAVTADALTFSHPVFGFRMAWDELLAILSGRPLRQGVGGPQPGHGTNALPLPQRMLPRNMNFGKARAARKVLHAFLEDLPRLLRSRADVVTGVPSTVNGRMAIYSFNDGPARHFDNWYADAREAASKLESDRYFIGVTPDALFLRAIRLNTQTLLQPLAREARSSHHQNGAHGANGAGQGGSHGGNRGESVGDALLAFLQERERILARLLALEPYETHPLTQAYALADGLVRLVRHPSLQGRPAAWVRSSPMAYARAAATLQTFSENFDRWRSLFHGGDRRALQRCSEASRALHAAAATLSDDNIEQRIFDACGDALLENPFLLALASGLLDVTTIDSKPLFLVGTDAVAARLAKRLLGRYPFETFAGATEMMATAESDQETDPNEASENSDGAHESTNDSADSPNADFGDAPASNFGDAPASNFGEAPTSMVPTSELSDDLAAGADADSGADFAADAEGEASTTGFGEAPTSVVPFEGQTLEHAHSFAGAEGPQGTDAPNTLPHPHAVRLSPEAELMRMPPGVLARQLWRRHVEP